MLRFALTPSEETTDQQMKRSAQVIQRLEKDLDMRVVPYTAGDYVSIVEAMRAKKVDVAWLGSFSYVLAVQEAGAEAFVAGVRKSTGKASYTSLIFVRGDAPYQSVMDLKGKSFAFVDPASTSGHLFPRAGMMKLGIADPASFFSQVVFAGAHDAAQLAVLNRRVDAGASNDRVWTTSSSGATSSPATCGSSTARTRSPSARSPGAGTCRRRPRPRSGSRSSGCAT